MIPKRLRVPPGLFSKKPDSRFFSEYFQVKIFSNTFGYNRFGVSIGTKTEKSSVRRHFWKRAILKHILQQKNFSNDFVVVTKPGLAKVSEKELKTELSLIFKKLK